MLKQVWVDHVQLRHVVSWVEQTLGHISLQRPVVDVGRETGFLVLSLLEKRRVQTRDQSCQLGMRIMVTSNCGVVGKGRSIGLVVCARNSKCCEIDPCQGVGESKGRK